MNNITLVAIDTKYHNLTAMALSRAAEISKISRVLLFSDQNFFPGSEFVKIDKITSKQQYSEFVLKEVGKHIATDHFIMIQHDGMPVNSDKWNPDFLNYDYIGAPWPWLPENIQVGNGGFSLRSRRLAELCLDSNIIIGPKSPEDEIIGQTYKSWFESKGIKYAPLELAWQFSAENPPGKYPSYGFHGMPCMSYYLDDSYMEKYIQNMIPEMFLDWNTTFLAIGLYKTEKYDLLEEFVDCAYTHHADYKYQLISFVNSLKGRDITLASEFETLLENY
jgi:hypothetical protein